MKMDTAKSATQVIEDKGSTEERKWATLSAHMERLESLLSPDGPGCPRAMRRDFRRAMKRVRRYRVWKVKEQAAIMAELDRITARWFPEHLVDIRGADDA